MGAHEWGVIALLAVLIVIIGTFDYAYLPFAVLWGFVFFAETPGPATIAGMIIIAIAGLLVIGRMPIKSIGEAHRECQ